MIQHKLTQKHKFQISNYLDSISEEEKKVLIDSLVDPVFVIANANEALKSKLEKFVDSDTREYMYMIERAQKRITQTVDILRDYPSKQ